MLFGSFFLCWRVKILNYWKGALHSTCCFHTTFTSTAATGEILQLAYLRVPTARKLWAVITWGQLWVRISGGMLSLFSSHLQARIFKTLKIPVLLCCFWQRVWPFLVQSVFLELLSCDSACGDGGVFCWACHPFRTKANVLGIWRVYI